MQDDYRLQVHGQTFILSASRTAFWEEESALLCSDLHWGREAFMQSRGYALPEGVFANELSVLDAQIHKHGSKKVFFLGDLIHHAAGMHDELVNKIRSWTEKHSRTEMILIPGNHDRAIQQWLPRCGIQLGDREYLHHGVGLMHEPSEKPARAGVNFTWYGHLHPAVKIHELGGHRKFPAFLIRGDHGFLPAFSRLAGGAEFERHSESDQVFLAGEDFLLPWPGR